MYDEATRLAWGFVRLSADYAGGTVPVSTVVAVPAGTTKTYTLRTRTLDVNTDLGLVTFPRLIAATFPFGGTGGATLAAKGSR